MRLSIIIAGIILAFIFWRRTYTKPAPGDQAPDFELIDQHGKAIRLSKLLNSASHVVIFFYPKDDSYICTKQVCQLRDLIPEIPSDIVLIGISSDSPESHKAFAKVHSLPFSLLSDPDNRVRDLYGAYTAGFSDRVTFIIDKNGTILARHNNMLSLSEHIDMVRKLSKTAELD